MLQPTRHRLVVIQTFIRQIYNRSICMRYAAAGNVLMLKTGYECVSTLTLTHLRSPTSSGWHVITGLSHGGCNGEWGRWPGPLLTVLDARECYSLLGRATPSGYTDSTRHTHTVWAKGVSANPHVHSRGNQSGWITHGGIFAL